MGAEANSNKTDCVQRNLYKAGRTHSFRIHTDITGGT